MSLMDNVSGHHPYFHFKTYAHSFLSPKWRTNIPFTKDHVLKVLCALHLPLYAHCSKKGIFVKKNIKDPFQNSFVV